MAEMSSYTKELAEISLAEAEGDVGDVETFGSG